MILTEFLDFISLSPSTMIISVANLLILSLILKKFLFKPVQAIIAKRQNEIAHTYEKAESELEKGEEHKKLYATKMGLVEEERKAILATTEKVAQKHKERAISETKEEIQEMQQKAQKQIARERQNSEEEFKKQVAVISSMVAGKILEREINPSDHEKMVENFVEQLEVVQ